MNLGRLSASRAIGRRMCSLEFSGGRVVKLMGDGSLVEFTSVVAAASCALEIGGAKMLFKKVPEKYAISRDFTSNADLAVAEPTNH